MFIDFAAQLVLGAPAERNVRKEEYVESDISLSGWARLYALSLGRSINSMKRVK